MSATTQAVKRHHRPRQTERRGQHDAGSSRDASEEDNDEGVSDVGSLMSVDRAQPGSNRTAPPTPLSLSAALGRRSAAQKRVGELSAGEGSQSEAGSPTYDGDVESSSTIGAPAIHTSHANTHRRPSIGTTVQASKSSSPTAEPRAPTPKVFQPILPDANIARATSPVQIPHRQSSHAAPTDVPVAISVSLPEARKSQTLPLSKKTSSSALGPPKMMARPKELPLEDIRAFVQRAIDGKGDVDGVERWWRTNPAPEGKVVRVYADGVYDLFHFGHALQLRQAKLSFPNVHLLVGVSSDKDCAAHKSAPAMTHAERCESVRHCRWVDEVLPDGPWVVDQSWLDKHQIDYIAHDELVYPGAGHEDVYGFAKGQGRFVPTRRTPAISTSDLLERIVRGYRDGFFDSKLSKNGHPELLAADVDWDSSTERREKRERREREAKRDSDDKESD